MYARLLTFTEVLIGSCRKDQKRGRPDELRSPTRSIEMHTVDLELWRYSLSLTRREMEYRDSLMNWLPPDIIDAHAHCNLPGHVGVLPERVQNHMMSTFPSLTLEESIAIKAIFFPGKKVRTLRFASAFSGIDHFAANDYLLKNSPSDDRVALYVLPDDIDYSVQMMDNVRVSALKAYYLYFDPPATRIYQYFPKEVLEVAQFKGIPIILHLPRLITLCGDDLMQVLTDFPRLRIVLAHLGLPHLMVPGLEASYERFSNFENLFMDTSMIPSPEVVELALRKFGSNRITYGSDEPLNLIRAATYPNPEKGQRLVSEYPYHWVDPEEQAMYARFAIDVMHTHWQSIQAIRDAWDKFSINEQGRIRVNVFSRTAKELYGF